MTARRSPHARWVVRTLVLGLVAVAAGYLLGIARTAPLSPSADAAVTNVSPRLVRIAAFGDAGGGIEIAPVGVDADTLLIYYPGGRVRPHAYTWLGVALAPVGVRTLIPTMPFDLAVLGRDRATRLLDAKRDGERTVVLAGHSLGGAMAASWARRNPGILDGLILLGAYPPRGDDLSALTLRTLVIAADQDRLATLQEVEDGLARLPRDAGLERVPGAVHAFFGRYGPQVGDGLPSVTRHEAEMEIASGVEAFVESLR